MPRCPIFIPSKGRYDHNTALTARTLSKDGVPFTLVVERAEAELYTERFGEDRVAVLPDEIAGTGSSVPARNHLWASLRSKALPATGVSTTTSATSAACGNASGFPATPGSPSAPARTLPTATRTSPSLASTT
jgi:hypothetical protein